MSRARRLVPASIARRLLISYLSVFAIVLAGSALVVHIAFVTILGRDATQRLESVGSVAQSVVDWTEASFGVDVGDETLRALNPSVEGVQWYDEAGRLVASHGIVAPPVDPSRSLQTHAQRMAIGNTMLDTVTLVTRDPANLSRHGFIRVSVSEAPLNQAVRKGDTSILAGYVLAILGGLIAGRWLTGQALDQIETSMRTLQEFTADAAHELRGPLTAIATSAATATRSTDAVVHLKRERLESIVSAASQMTRLTDDLLILARADRSLENELFVVDVAACVKRVADLYREEAQRRSVTLTADDAGTQRIYGSPDQIDRILGNLVENAIRYTQPGGKVGVYCRQERTGCSVVVVDSGIGIAPEHFERVFERFWRADPSRSADGGSGLGLAIARVLVRRHGGDITVASKLGAGSEFVVRFPARPPR